jgi:hypothetical protein
MASGEEHNSAMTSPQCNHMCSNNTDTQSTEGGGSVTRGETSMAQPLGRDCGSHQTRQNQGRDSGPPNRERVTFLLL